jgi:DNA-directed RNA polymerase subunit N (RpoN/RPB10)
MVVAMEKDAIKLRERYKHNPDKQKDIARDWMNYAKAVQELKSASELLDVDWEDGAYDRFDENTKESYAVVYEVGKRVLDELGKESHLKVVHDRLQKKAEAVNEVLTENGKRGH